MKAYTDETGFDIRFVGENYPWMDLGNGTVVDVLSPWYNFIYFRK